MASVVTVDGMAGVHPDLIAKVVRILNAMATLGYPMFVCQGVRTTEQQQALYAQGRTASGPIVTNTDGVVKRSNHQIQADGFGHAVDLAFTSPKPFDESHPWDLYGAMVTVLGLTWGGNWKTIRDRPHCEL